MADARITTDVVEVLAGGTPDARLATQFVEVLAGGTTEMRVATQYVELLTPSAVSTVFIGWGVPL